MSAFEGKDKMFDSWCKMNNKKNADNYIKELEAEMKVLLRWFFVNSGMLEYYSMIDRPVIEILNKYKEDI
jgi:hypothetical protein